MSDGTAIRLDDQRPERAELEREVVAGLSASPKRLSPKLFYDRRGSELFERITELPEYYPTRTEISILRDHARDIAALAGPRASLIEFGSGSSTKTRILLDALAAPAAYVPVDISGRHLLEAARRLAADYPRLEVLPVSADFTRPFELPMPKVMPLRNLVFFPGSTIGNFAPEPAVALLGAMAAVAKAGGAAIVGVDLRKDRDVLERAYNDAAGVTAQFNLNVLERLNRELGADFDAAGFRHEAVWNGAEGRIEMWLRSLRRQQAGLAGRRFVFEAGEGILTECSYKLTPEQFVQMARRAGFAPRAGWTDARRWFSVQYLER